MKIAKVELMDFLSKLSVGDLITEAVLEAGGYVTISVMDELVAAGKTDCIAVPERIALKNITLIKKVAAKMGATKDASIQFSIEDLKVRLADTDEQYEFRCADPATVESMHDDRDRLFARKEALEGIKLKEYSIRRIRDAIANLAADRVSLYVDNNKLLAVVIDTATDSTATVELCTFKGKPFKNDFRASMLNKILALTGADGAMLYAGYNTDNEANCLIIELPSGDFTYILSALIIEGTKE